VTPCDFFLWNNELKNNVLTPFTSGRNLAKHGGYHQALDAVTDQASFPGDPSLCQYHKPNGTKYMLSRTVPIYRSDLLAIFPKVHEGLNERCLPTVQWMAVIMYWNRAADDKK
jgi:hypothetical protein